MPIRIKCRACRETTLVMSLKTKANVECDGCGRVLIEGVDPHVEIELARERRSRAVERREARA